MATMIESISAVTLATHDMSRAVHFYRTVVRRLNSRGSGRERAFSISLRGRGAKLVLGGASLSVIPTPTLSMRA
jgi:hypothetical protein